MTTPDGASDTQMTTTASGASGPAITVRDLVKNYDEVRAVRGVNFEVATGEVFGFLGPNGAGKTTAMRAILGVTSLDSGSIRFDGALVDDRARRRFGYMPEERGLYPGMLVGEEIEYLGRLHGLSRSDAAAARWTFEWTFASLRMGSETPRSMV